VTPPEFIRDYNPAFAALLEQGRQELILFKDAPLALAASEYNRQEMLALGFKRVEVLPYFVSFNELRASVQNSAGREIVRRYTDGWTNILFVGRLVPNKRQDNLIHAFNYYHRLIDPHSRLILIGSDANAPGYRLELQTLIEGLDLKHVELPGPIGPREGLGAYYQTASVFLCLSEHEGFCVPLLEAMAFDVPVLALHATGVPYALGESGILLKQKRYDVLAELLHLLVTDTSFRTGVVTAQRRRLADFDVSTVTQKLQQVVIDLQGIWNQG
jgi:glycosyltransferase involved in cell wall biosynthesis